VQGKTAGGKKPGILPLLEKRNAKIRARKKEKAKIAVKKSRVYKLSMVSGTAFKAERYKKVECINI